MQDIHSYTDHSSPMSTEALLACLYEYQAAGIAFPLTVTGISMVPFLHHMRDSVLLVSPTQRKARRGEILFFRRADGSLVLHRCLKVYKDGSYLLNGDSQQWCEHPAADQLIGVVETICRKGTYISCDRLSYRLLTAVWMICKPIRPTLFRTVAGLRRLFGRSARSPKSNDK